ncbi:hypothetical protein BDA99DRAFT_609922 [Phascolomyces articulosus]|uniref:Uncharacterized protein n=1 Tax=Phascolomyces articulosus TaxID=60185 RepID=A0AAD5JY75_9FUNG|nr:hypothetical protein BDA99DRAFT_609922 [Phascolomyces articulosus]
MKTSTIITLVTLFSIVHASTIPLEARSAALAKNEHCSKFNDTRVESLCEDICKEYGVDADYILGKCGRSGICNF